MRTLHLAMHDTLVVVTGDEDGWSATTELEGTWLECVAASPERPERIFVGTFEGGLLRSVDGGDTFERVGEDAIRSDAVTAVRVDPTDPSTVWAGTEPSELYRSTDGGGTWEHRPGIADQPSADEWFFPPRPETHHVRWIEPDPTEAGRLYVGIEAGAFLLSTDGGGSWTERPPGSRRDNHTLATHPDAPGRVYAAAGDGYAESADGGETWTHPQRGLDHRYVWGLAVDPGDPDTVVVSAARGAGAAHRPPGSAHVYRRADGGAWERLEGPGLPTGDGALRAVLAGGLEAGEIVGATDRGPFRTVDGGDTWERLPVAWPERLHGRTARGLVVLP